MREQTYENNVSMDLIKQQGGTVIAVTSGKAGVGKSTVVANLGYCLAEMGKKVCVADANFGMRSLDLYLGLENRIVFDWMDVIEERAQPYQMIVKARNIKMEENLHLLPTSGIPAHIAKTAAPEILPIIDELKKVYDYILIDAPSLTEHGFENIIHQADRVILVTKPSINSLRDTDRLIGYLDDEENLSFILNEYNPKLPKRKVPSIEDVTHTLAITLLGVILEDEDTYIAGQIGKPIVMNRSSINAAVFRNIARRITGEEVEIFESIEKQVRKRGRRGLLSFL
ncbi:septum site-determining protein MinD [Ectobacillus panaciterrae]|uniref:septum site-determining protein MinD n=1 Tax=Ectobacillus panaciterrae TaxID=363872 RepID=UPI00040166A5|nr:septum site-determining protein MinD [Ectobacillus panaciterrae]